MKFSIAVAVAALASGAVAQYNSTVTAETTVWTTYCPTATTLTYGTNVYTVSEATTLTITSDCGCDKTTSAAVSATPAPYTNGTASTVATSVLSTGSVATATTSMTAYTGAASRSIAGAGAAIAGLAAAVAMAL